MYVYETNGLTIRGQKCKNKSDTAKGHCNLNDKIDIYIKYSEPVAKSGIQEYNKPFFQCVLRGWLLCVLWCNRTH